MQESSQLHALVTLSPKERAPDSQDVEGWDGPRGILTLKKK